MKELIDEAKAKNIWLLKATEEFHKQKNYSSNFKPRLCMWHTTKVQINFPIRKDFKVGIKPPYHIEYRNGYLFSPTRRLGSAIQ